MPPRGSRGRTTSDTWPDDLERVRRTWVEMIRTLAGGETVHLLVNDASFETEVAARLRRSGVDTRRVVFHRIPTVDVWIRDYGPTFITREDPSGALAFVNWRFNAWGMKYPEYVADDAVPPRINESLGLPAFTPGIVLEGGSIDVNGAGLCLVTEECLLNPNRNSGRTRQDIEALLRSALGLQRVVWLPAGMAGDDTDGHIDNLARFVNPGTAVCVVEEDPRDENYLALQENYRRLTCATDLLGRRLDVVPLPQPDPVMAGGSRLPASYANFYIANGVVLVPLYGGPKDRAALDRLAALVSGPPGGRYRRVRADQRSWRHPLRHPAAARDLTRRPRDLTRRPRVSSVLCHGARRRDQQGSPGAAPAAGTGRDGAMHRCAGVESPEQPGPILSRAP